MKQTLVQNFEASQNNRLNYNSIHVPLTNIEIFKFLQLFRQSITAFLSEITFLFSLNIDKKS